jgi:hypothetical protein
VLLLLLLLLLHLTYGHVLLLLLLHLTYSHVLPPPGRVAVSAIRQQCDKKQVASHHTWSPLQLCQFQLLLGLPERDFGCF